MRKIPKVSFKEHFGAKKIITVFTAGVLFAASMPAIPGFAAEADITYTKPYLLTLNPDSEMNICWLTSGDGAGSVEIGETDALGQTVKAKQYELKGMRTSHVPTATTTRRKTIRSLMCISRLRRSKT